MNRYFYDYYESDTKIERVRCPMPLREMERRWSAVRQAMKQEGIDALIMQNNNEMLGGYVRYFTDIPPHGYSTTVIFPADQEMFVLDHGAGNPAAPTLSDRGIQRRIGLPYVNSLKTTQDYVPKAALDVMRSLNVKKVGWVNQGVLPMRIADCLRDGLPKTEFVDATDLVDKIKMIKSADEMVYIRKAVRIHDILEAALPAIIRPGRYDYDIRNEVMRIASDMGSEEQLVMSGSAPNGQNTKQLRSCWLNRRIEPGDQVYLMMEVSGPGGYYGEIGRTFCLGEPSKEMVHAWETAVKAQEAVEAMLRPGTKVADLFRTSNRILTENGYPAEKRIFGHGQGYDLVERPVFSEDEELQELQEGMFISTHPLAQNDKAYAFCCDNFYITKDGCERITQTPREIFII